MSAAAVQSKYDPAYAVLAERLCRTVHATDQQLADILDVSVATIGAWKNAHPEFMEALTRGKADADAEVRAALFKRATGYTYKRQRICQNKDVAWIEEHDEHVPAETTAAIFWLCNRDKANWQQRQTTSHEVIKPITLAYALPEKSDHLKAVQAIDVTPSPSQQKAG